MSVLQAARRRLAVVARLVFAHLLFAHLQVRTRLLLGFGLVIGLSVFIAALASQRIHALQDMARAIADIDRQQVAEVRLMKEHVADAYVSILAMSILTDKEALDEENEFLGKYLQQYGERQAALQAGLAATPHTTGGDAALRRDVDSVQEAERAGRAAIQAVVSGLLTPGERGTKGYNVLNGVRNTFDGWQRALRTLSGALGERSLAMVQQAEATAASARWVLGGASLAAVLTGLVAVVTLLRSVLPPLQQAMQASTAISQGDLCYPLPRSERQDELGRLLSELAAMQGGLRRLIEQVQDTGRGIAVATGQISAGTQDLSQRTEHTAGRLQQASSAVAAIALSVRQADDTVARADRLAGEAAGTAERGGAAVREVAAVMQAIHHSSGRIEEIISVIDGFAFQTNILALNAAVEAAQAGEHGRGFAVVAGEVRALARRSGDAAKEVRGLIDASVQHVREGVATVQRAGASMDQILQGIGALSALVSEIARAVREQSTSLGAVSRMVGEIDAMTQQNAAMVEQANASTLELDASARQLQRAVMAFKLPPPVTPHDPSSHARHAELIQA